MTTATDTSTATILKFQNLLRELFQFDCADLDFGIYRIMNHKRDVIEKFISEELPARIEQDLQSGQLARQERAATDLAEARQNVLVTLGKEALDADGNLSEVFSNTPAGRSYLEARDAAAPGRSRQAVEADVYNHLYTFFSRYYQDGDFISRRRYGRNQRYAIPYSGEEVYLHWANSDQYYVKTAEYFHNYNWKAPNGVTVHFRLDSANVEQNNVKSEKRFFLPQVEDTTWDGDARAVTIPFEYRPLSTAESRTYGSRNQQDKIIGAAVNDISQRLIPAPDALSALMTEHRRNGNDEPVTHLEHHLRQYTRRNDSDFFIHKDLHGFLSRELDFYLKNEVLNLDNLQAAGESAAEGWFQQMRLIKSVGGEIIDFLAQIEGFQKMLWEKRKFVVDTHYCVTLGNVQSDFHQEIVDNDGQWEEWRELFGIEGSDRSFSFLQSHPTLPLDTRHFSADFNDRLLASFEDIDGMTDGLLVHSENWQGLQFMQEKYSRRVQCVYIDPPYNTDASPILYKNDYKDSSWLSLLGNRLSLSVSLMAKSAVLSCAIDDEEAPLLQLAMRDVFAKQLGIVPVRSNPAGRKSKGKFTPMHDYAFFFGNEEAIPGKLPKTEKELSRYPLVDNESRFAWNNLIRHGSNDRREDRPHQFYPIYVSADDVIRVPDMEWDENKQENLVLEEPKSDEIAIYPIRIEDGAIVEKNWHRGWDAAKRMPQSEYRIRRNQESNEIGAIDLDFKIRPDMNALPKTWWDEKKYASANLGGKVLKELFGRKNFDFAKATGLVEDCLRASLCRPYTATLDYFAGSGTTGHAVINLNREDGGQRKFILVEMGEYFDTVLLPRIKKVTFSPEWKDGRPKRAATPEEAERSPRIVKYMRLESYEDALDGIGFDDEAGRMNLDEQIEGYLLKYMLKWETKQSETLLNTTNLTRPFDYRLRAHANGEARERTADVAETFNYLLGLNVQTRKVYNDDCRRYLVYVGETRENPGHSVVVVWRETEGWTEEDFARDRRFAKAQGFTDADTLYVNGGSVIPGARAIEPLFKARMFAGVSG